MPPTLRSAPRPPRAQASSIAASLGTLDAATGGVAGLVRRRLRGLGVRGLDAGIGCGAMLGYGWGAGLILKPTALTSLREGLAALRQRAAAALPPPMADALARHPAPGGAATASAAQLGMPSVAGGDPALGASNGSGGAQQAAAAVGTGGPSAGSIGSATAADRALAELSRLVVRQQAALGDLEEQVQALQAAVCRLDPAAPGCKR